MTEEKLKKITYGLMALTLGLIAIGVLFPIGIASTYVGLGIPISIINIYLIHSYPIAQEDVRLKKWARMIYVFYGSLFVFFTLLTILIGFIFSFGF